MSNQSNGGLIPAPPGGAVETWVQISLGCAIIPPSAVRTYGTDVLSVPGQCVCLQPWSSVTGRTCPMHGHIAPAQITC
jgi:hypothetical protein